jgi:uncharacterized iron-regulated protein
MWLLEALFLLTNYGQFVEFGQIVHTKILAANQQTTKLYI